MTGRSPSFRQLAAGIKLHPTKIRNSQKNSSTGPCLEDKAGQETHAGFDEQKVNPKKKRKRARKPGNPLESSDVKIARLHQEQVNRFRNEHKMFVCGSDLPDPCSSFQALRDAYNLTPTLIQNITKVGFEEPTPVQMQTIPVLLHDRELLASAPTGSGKTAAFVIPLIQQIYTIKDAKGTKEGTRIRAVILEPTRELAKQICWEFERLSEGMNVHAHLLSQNPEKAIHAVTSLSIDVLITTPNRFIHLLDESCLKLEALEWLVVDESDRLFAAGDHGFRDQLGKIYQACSEAKKLKRAFFSATFSYEVEEWCKLNLDNVIVLCVGARNSAVESVHQELVFTGNEHGKLVALRNMINEGQLKPPVLIFVQSKDRADQLYSELEYEKINAGVIHADRSQTQRDEAIHNFRTGQTWVLICTELMGRGIDIKGVGLVINFDFPTSIVSYIHRIGRTGRAGKQGRAVTFFTQRDTILLKPIAALIQQAGYEVPKFVLSMKKPLKRQRKELEARAPKRKKISNLSRSKKKKSEKRSQPVLKKNLKKLKSLKKPKPHESS